MEKTTEQKIELVWDTVNYYSENPSERRCKSYDGCVYSPTNADKPNSEGCAVGRLLTDELKIKLDNVGIIGTTGVGEIFHELPDDIRAYSQYLLESLQSLHDRDDNWTPDGISDEGEEYVKKIINTLMS